MSAARARAVDVFAAVGEPNRRRILELLAVGDRAVGELAAELGIAQPSVSQHLAVLTAVGLVASARVGTRSVYSVVPAPLAELTTWAAGITRSSAP